MTDAILLNTEFGSAEGYTADTATEQLENWLSKHIPIPDVVVDIITYFNEHAIERFSVLNNINVDEHERGKGHGGDLLSNFIDESDPYPILLLCDALGEQEHTTEPLDRFYDYFDFETIFTMNNYPIMVYPADFAADLKQQLSLKQDKQYIAEWLSEQNNQLTSNDVIFKETQKPIDFFQQHIDDMYHYMDESDFVRIKLIKDQIQQTGIKHPVFIAPDKPDFIMEGRHRIIAQYELGETEIACFECQRKPKPALKITW